MRRLKYSQKLASVTPALALCLGAGSASAVVNVVNVNQTLGFLSFVSFDATASSFVTSYNTGYNAGVRNCSVGLLQFDTDFSWTDGALSLGDVVSATSTFSASGTLYLSYPASGEKVYVGYRLENQGTGSDTHYGYVKLTGNATADHFDFDFYSYESTANTAITVVPEPSSAGLALMGSLLLFGFRRVRR